MIELIGADFMLRALVAGLLLAAVGGAMGSLLVWRRMAFYSDTLAHASLLGIALGLMLHVPLWLGAVALALLMSALLWRLKKQDDVATDTLLGVLTPAALAAGMVVISQLPQMRVDVMGLLFGDILAVTWADVAFCGAGAVAVLGTLVLLWRRLIAATIAPDLAAIAGYRPRQLELIFMVLLSLTIALGMQLVGVLLVSALLLIPAATARRYAHTPLQMAIWASGLGMVSVAGGLLVSLWLNWPAGAAIVLVATALFLLRLK